MAWLVIGMILFIGVHLAGSVRAWREPMVERFGEWPYKGVYALIALIGLVLAGFGYGRADPEWVWAPVVFGHEVAAALMPLAVVLLVAAYVPTNIKRLTAHPMLWGVVLFAIAHLLVRGHWAAIVLFGGLGLYSLIAMALGSVRGERPSNKVQPFWKDAVVIAVGLVLYVVLLLAHPVLFGVAVVN
ncbi:MAG: hypothetical protein EA419_08345 [Wenzhouxiangella sp.]|nr:MAG: hypothetical protein EA419_08345 [Wenzhouxiangella sp.]